MNLLLGCVPYPNLLGYADKYREQVESIRSMDSASFSLSAAVAKNLYHLMAYKDEYEVARLYCEKDYIQKIKNRFEGDYELEFNLAPPLLSRIDKNSGRPLKRKFGGWMMKVFSLLARLKSLRGTRFDVFAYTAERKLERQDIDDYLSLLEQVKSGLTNENYDIGLQLCETTEKLRGFGPVKAANREKVKKNQVALMKEFLNARPAIINAA